MSGEDTGQHEDVTGRHHYRSPSGDAGKRWYDPARMVMVLFGIVGFFTVAWGGFVFSVAYTASQKNLEQDGQIKAMVEQLMGIKQNQDKQDAKLDRVLERLPK